MTSWRRLIRSIAAIVVIAIGLELLSDNALVVVVLAIMIGSPLYQTWVARDIVRLATQAPDIISLGVAARRSVTLAIAAWSSAIAAVIVVAALAGAIRIRDLPDHPVTLALAISLILMILPAYDTRRTFRDVWGPLVRDRNGDAPS